METIILCAECFGVIPAGSDVSCLMLDTGEHGAVIPDREYCGTCSEKLAAVADAALGQDGACSICGGSHEKIRGRLQVRLKNTERNMRLCNDCIGALSRGIDKLRARCRTRLG